MKWSRLHTNNRTCQIAISILVLKYATKMIKMISKGTRVRWSTNCFDLRKWSTLQKLLRNSAMEDNELDGERENKKRQTARMLDRWSTQELEEKGST